MKTISSQCARSPESVSQFPSYSIFAADASALKEGLLKRICLDLSMCLPALKIRDYFRIKPDILSTSDHVIIAERPARGRARAKVIAVLAAKWFTAPGFKFLHIMTIFVSEEFQGTLLFKRLWQALFRDLLQSKRGESEFPSAFSLKTYNPISCALIEQIARKTRSHFYPSFQSTVPAWMQDPVRTIARVLEPGSNLDIPTGVIKGGGNSVPADFYPELPRSANSQIMSHFTSELTPDDRLLCCLFCPQPDTQTSILHEFGVLPRQLQQATA